MFALQICPTVGFFFFRMNLSNFIKVTELHPNVKTKQYEKVHLPSILGFFFFFFFERMNLSNFIKVNELHSNIKTKQYEKVHLPSILENLVCI